MGCGSPVVKHSLPTVAAPPCLLVACGRGSPMVKVTDLLPAVVSLIPLKPNTAEESPCSGGPMHVKYVEAQTSSRR
ncbi:hypothetical protein TNCV_258591 [Trichonephila clavipes]|uniref:Uncharacterized protein n=1 Tax=Trichonephila clavipes TaxID=2585209 RepID=A0A8X6RT61_TRICX|nr:hypothetical protein TNCV_258591 [Trichonephila clavipes]